VIARSAAPKSRVIEGACRYLVQDRMVTPAHWSPTGAEAICTCARAAGERRL
jgi:hypothetical protein